MKAVHQMVAAAHRHMSSSEPLAMIIQQEAPAVQECPAVHPGQAATAVTMCGKAHCITLNNWKDYRMVRMMDK